jgi:hypothetical protein
MHTRHLIYGLGEIHDMQLMHIVHNVCQIV